VRKFAKIALVVCLTVLSVPAALYSFVWLWVWYKTAEVDSFYQEHRLLGEMRAGEKESTNNSAHRLDPFRKSEPLARGSPPCIILSDDYRSHGAFR